MNSVPRHNPVSLHPATPLIVFMAAVAMVTGCRPAAKTPGKPHVAGIIFQEDQFFRMIEMGMKDAANRRGAELHMGNSSGQVDREVSLIDTYLARGVDTLVISPLSGTASAVALKRAHEQGVKIVTYNTGLDPQYTFPVSHIESDQVELGASTGRAARAMIEKKLGGKAKVAVIGFASQVPEQGAARAKGFLGVVDPKALPGVEIVAQQDAWMAEQAATVVERILVAHPDVQVVWAANEGGTVGAVTAVRHADKAGKVFVFGTDMSDQLADFLLADDNILQAVTAQKPLDIGQLAVETALDALAGKAVPKKTALPGALFTRDQPEEIRTYREEMKRASR